MSGRRDVRSAVGTELVLDIGPVAHGGHWVARHEGRVVFVRHTLTGERIRAVVTDGHDGSAFWRADAIEVLTAAPTRVEPPCPWSGPGRCGGCDFQHVAIEEQRKVKAAVVHEHLGRTVEVEAVPGDDGGLGWRTRVHYAVDAAGAAGLRQHRSHLVVPVDRCRIAHPLVQAAEVTGRSWPGVVSIEVAAAPVSGDRAVLADGVAQPGSAATLREVVGEQTYQVAAGGFWQVHPGAAGVLLGAVLDGLEPRPGDIALDLYGGVGLFAAALADRVGPTGRVTLVESDRQAVADAKQNLAAWPAARIERGRVDHVLRRLHLGRADVVVLDPPRAGAGRAVVDLLTRLRARRIVYVACDPASLGRDLRRFEEQGMAVVGLRAFDLFPMTSHVECVAALEPVSGIGATPRGRQVS